MKDHVEAITRSITFRIESNQLGRKCVAASLIETAVSLRADNIPNADEFENHLRQHNPKYDEGSEPILDIFHGAKYLGIKITKIVIESGQNQNFNRYNIPEDVRDTICSPNSKDQEIGRICFERNLAVMFSVQFKKI